MNSTEQFAKTLRKTTTTTESLLWRHLRSRQINELKFRRQHAIGPYIADFYCAELQLIIEIDGDVHDVESVRLKDQIRNEYLREHGFEFIRVTNDDVLRNIEGVLEHIKTLTLALSLKGRGNKILFSEEKEIK